MSATCPRRPSNIGIAFDGKGGLYVVVAGAGNICTDPNVPKDQKPVGLKPCPLLNGRAGMWRFDAEKTGQKFPDGGEQLATGVRDMMALDWSKDLKASMASCRAATAPPSWCRDGRRDTDPVAEEMHRIDKGADLGWPYTYYDTRSHARVLAPEYGGDGKMPARGKLQHTGGGVHLARSPVDLQFYDGKQFPRNIGAALSSRSRAVRARNAGARPQRL